MTEIILIGILFFVGLIAFNIIRATLHTKHKVDIVFIGISIFSGIVFITILSTNHKLRIISYDKGTNLVKISYQGGARSGGEIRLLRKGEYNEEHEYQLMGKVTVKIQVLRKTPPENAYCIQNFKLGNKDSNILIQIPVNGLPPNCSNCAQCNTIIKLLPLPK